MLAGLTQLDPGMIPTALTVGLLLAVIPAGVQSQPEGKSTPKAKLQRPELTDFVQADYPDEARKEGVAGDVVLILTIDAEGRVQKATIQKGLGHGLDEAAKKAALQFKFEPAKRGQRPVRSRIRYRYTFELPEKPKPEPESANKDPEPEQSKPPEAIEVTVRGQSRADELRNSARSVEVLDTEAAKKESGDMGEVVSQSEGVNVRRTGGLGSGSRLSIHGLNDNQIRFFLDGVPLRYAGYPFGLVNVPVNLIDRIDIYKGVVPADLGADALGGAIDLIPPRSPERTGMYASYQVGSFDTHRVTLTGTLKRPSGFYARANTFFDYSKNNYEVDVEVADDSGQSYQVEVPRFHDAYRALGGGLEFGATGLDWADNISARVFMADMDRELQHNTIMTVPYGGVEAGQTAAGAVLRYDHAPTDRLTLDLNAGYNFTRRSFEDTSTCIYDWFGRCVRDDSSPGEIGEFPTDQVVDEHAGYARLNADWDIADHHTLSFSMSPTVVTRTGEQRAEAARTDRRDPLSAQRDLYNLVTGVEYRLTLFDERLENIAFVKDYVQAAFTEEPLPTGAWVENDRITHRVGFGDSLRFRINDWLSTKASYEWATRLPTAEEIFGNARLIQPNLDLEPELSHNANLSLKADSETKNAGRWQGEVTGFVRDTNGLIVLLGNRESYTYQNVLQARSVGVEAAAGWTSNDGIVDVDGNVTYVDLRNTSDSGTYADFKGDRIPNRPYLYANGKLRLKADDVFNDGDSLSGRWRTRFVGSYYRGWESLGASEFKTEIPAQLSHSVAVTYQTGSSSPSLSTTLEIQNLTDAKLYDFFGVQRPGRSFYLKMTLAI